MREISEETYNDGLRYHPGGLSAAQKPVGRETQSLTTVDHDRPGERSMREAASRLRVTHLGEQDPKNGGTATFGGSAEALRGDPRGPGQA